MFCIVFIVFRILAALSFFKMQLIKLLQLFVDLIFSISSFQALSNVFKIYGLMVLEFICVLHMTWGGGLQKS